MPDEAKACCDVTRQASVAALMSVVAVASVQVIAFDLTGLVLDRYSERQCLRVTRRGQLLRAG